MPTAAEKIGDYSHSQTNNGSTPTVLDPTNGRAPFANNQIPQNLWNPDAVKLLALFPLPTLSGPRTDYSYNYQFNGPSSYNDRLLGSYRLDYNISDRWRVFARVLRDYNEIGNPYAMNNFSYPNAAAAPSYADASGLGWFLEQRHGTTAVWT